MVAVGHQDGPIPSRTALPLAILCDDDEGALYCGDIKMSANVNMHDGGSFFSWNIETESHKAITGFNVYKKDKKSKTYKSVNNKLIPFKSDQQKYFFDIKVFLLQY